MEIAKNKNKTPCVPPDDGAGDSPKGSQDLEEHGLWIYRFLRGFIWRCVFINIRTDDSNVPLF